MTKPFRHSRRRDRISRWWSCAPGSRAGASRGPRPRSIPTYRATFETQNHYRGGGFNLDQCLDDTIEAARTLCLTPSDQAGAHTPNQKILRAGQRGLETHLLTEPFAFDRHARVAASRAALLATLIKYRMVSEVPKNITQRVPSAADLGRIKLSGENASLQAVLRPTAPEALYYWSMIEDAIALSCDATP